MFREKTARKSTSHAKEHGTVSNPKAPLLAADILDKYKHVLILMLIIICSSIFVFGGADWGLPTLLHADEGTIVNPAIKMLQNRSFEPDVFYRPDHLLIQINMLIYRVLVFLYGVTIENINDIGIEVFYLTARVVTGVFAVGSIILGYLIGKKYSNFVGLVSAFLFGFFPLYITHSHYATPDVPTVFFMLLFIYATLDYMQKPSFKNLILMALVTAAFITIKYPGAILCGMIAISVIVSSIVEKRYARIFKHGVSAIILVLAFIFLISPVLILKFDNVRQAFINEARSTHLGADGLGVSGNMLFYINSYLTASGIILLIFFFFGCYALLSRKQSILKNIPLFYSLIFWICLSCMPLHWERWGLPMYVSPLLISAIGIGKVYEIIKANKGFLKRRKLCFGIFTAVLCVSALNFITSSYANLLAFILPDTRVVSQAYCEENGINESNSVFEGYTTLNPSGSTTKMDAFEKMEDDVYYLGNNRIENIIISSNMYDRFKREPTRYTEQVSFYNSLDDNYIETKRFSGISRSSSRNEITNIYYNISYIIRAKNHGTLGPALIFYETAPQNYVPYTFSSTVYFDDANKSYDRYYITGLSEQEESGIWTQGNGTEFIFYLPDSEKDLTLSLNICPLVGDNLSAQIIEIVANGESIGTLEISEEGVYDIIIPKGIIDENRLNLKFLLYTATSPKELQVSKDERILSLFFYEMSIRENTR